MTTTYLEFLETGLIAVQALEAASKADSGKDEYLSVARDATDRLRAIVEGLDASDPMYATIVCAAGGITYECAIMGMYEDGDKILNDLEDAFGVVMNEPPTPEAIAAFTAQKMHELSVYESKTEEQAD